MITKEKLQEFHDRMIRHEVENDTAIVKLTTKELQELLEEIANLKEEIHILKETEGRQVYEDRWER